MVNRPSAAFFLLLPRRASRVYLWSWLWTLSVLVVPSLLAQQAPQAHGSRNVTVVSHLELEGAGNLEVEQDPARPFAYVARRTAPAGFRVIDLSTPTAARVLTTWELPDAGATSGVQDVVSFVVEGRSYLACSFRSDPDSPNASLGAIVFDVTGLPDPGAVREVARIQGPAAAGGFANLFAYRHSDGRVLLFAAGNGDALVYDVRQVLAGDAALLARIAAPEVPNVPDPGFHDVFVGYHVDTGQDRLYGAGDGGYAVFDVTVPSTPQLLTTINSAAVTRGRAITPTPDGRFVVTAAGYRNAPLRIFDLQPALEGTIPRVRTATGAWTADWRHFAERHEVRWPFIFVAALEDGFQVVNMLDPVNPYTDAYYRTYDGPAGTLADPPTAQYRGAWDVDVRNTDGLVVVSDLSTGFWAFTVEAFEGWDGRGWGMPNVSSAQDWLRGPTGAAQW